MLTLDFTFLFTAINLLVLYLALNKFFFKRLGGFMEKRSAAVAAEIESGRAAKAEGEEYRQKYEQMLKECAAENERLLAESRVMAQKEYDEILAKAKADADWIILSAREEAKREKKQTYDSLREEIVELAISAASKVVEANMDDEKNRDIVKSFLDKEDAA